MDKAEVARRQLGCALDMFLRQQDPVSTHTLVMAGGEIAERLAEEAGGEPFKNHILGTFPSMNLRELRELQRRYGNAFKHATDRQGYARDDALILTEFEPDVNEHMLLIGWHDYGMAARPLPIEAQVFEAWYLAKYPEKANSDETDFDALARFFPNIRALTPVRQFRQLQDGIKKARKMGTVMRDPQTDRRPLVLPWPA